ncbi:cold-shock protein [Pseudotabrizicola formosa]|uniref:cold-shock protein n=1 Tax=Pseudotabrizicola formosa TaxID=2030009 RepID=UPI000CD0FD3C|nr:cold shock domain-containing protein [Pseudotabrizicola formosa]
MTDEETATHIVHGHVKWFDPAKGFGFIVSNETESDILLHANVLRNYGQNSVSDGAMISVRVQQSPRGAQAVEVVSVQAPAGVALPLADEGTLMSAEQIAALALEPSRVKWFDKAKGFGFANVFGHNDDVFIHVEVLRMSGFADLQAGEAVCLRIIEGRRGRMAVQVASWEAASRAER